jgi:hypothetical protein
VHYWERLAAEHRHGMHDTIAQVRAAGWGDIAAGEAVRDTLETIEICSINVELLNRTGSFDDPAWIERRRDVEAVLLALQGRILPN